MAALEQPRGSRGTILIAGSLAQRPGHGGHTWVFLQYLLGFQRLGFEVLFLDWLDRTMCFDDARQPCEVEQSVQFRYFLRTMEEHGLGGSYSLKFNQGERTLGVAREQVLEKARGALLVLNIMGFLSDWEILALPARRVFLDIDPGFGQMWQELGLAVLFGGHDAYVTIGENIGRGDCTVPTCGFEWITTAQPVVLAEWPAQERDHGGAFTSIASWRGPFGPIEYRGRTHGLRVHEFRKFAKLPQTVSARFDLALEIDPSETRDLALLRENGWALLEPRAVAGDAASYRAFVQQSKAEFLVAKNLYVETRGGWFSDRSICYLASGRPVLAQDTGFTANYPTGAGLLAFATIEEARAGVEEITANYACHARAARQIAEEYFDSEKVLTRLLQKLEVTA